MSEAWKVDEPIEIWRDADATPFSDGYLEDRERWSASWQPVWDALSRGTSCCWKAHEHQVVIAHPSTREPGSVQLTWLDSKGAVMDAQVTTFKQFLDEGLPWNCQVWQAGSRQGQRLVERMTAQPLRPAGLMEHLMAGISMYCTSSNEAIQPVVEGRRTTGARIAPMDPGAALAMCDQAGGIDLLSDVTYVGDESGQTTARVFAGDDLLSRVKDLPEAVDEALASSRDREWEWVPLDHAGMVAIGSCDRIRPISSGDWDRSVELADGSSERSCAGEPFPCALGTARPFLTGRYSPDSPSTEYRCHIEVEGDDGRSFRIDGPPTSRPGWSRAFLAALAARVAQADAGTIARAAHGGPEEYLRSDDLIEQRAGRGGREAEAVGEGEAEEPSQEWEPEIKTAVDERGQSFLDIG